MDEQLYSMLDFLGEELNIEWEQSHNSFYFVTKNYDKYMNLIETIIYFQFNITDKMICYNFNSENFRFKIMPNNYVDFILDIYNNLNKYIIKKNYDKSRQD